MIAKHRIMLMTMLLLSQCQRHDVYLATTDTWYLDNGASRHMTHHNEWFEKISPMHGQHVICANDAISQEWDMFPFCWMVQGRNNTSEMSSMS